MARGSILFGAADPLIVPDVGTKVGGGGTVLDPLFPPGFVPPGAPPSAQPNGPTWNRGPATNPLVAARTAPMGRLNPIELQGPTTGGQDGWMAVAIDRPSFLWPTGYTYDGVTVRLPNYPTLFCPQARPENDSLAMRSVRRGIAYLSNPGIWWVKYGAPTAATPAKVQCLLIDANDPGNVSAYLSMPACNGYTQGRDAAISATPSLLVAGNPGRIALTLQNTSASGIIRVGIGALASNTVGFRVSAGGVNSVSFAGDGLPLDSIWVAAETGTLSMEYVEFY